MRQEAQEDHRTRSRG